MSESNEKNVTRGRIIGTTIVRVNVSDSAALSHKDSSAFVEHVKGNKILEIQRRGKFYIFRITNGELVVHLRLTGQLCAVDYMRSAVDGQMVSIDLSSGVSLRLIDKRKFAKVYFTEDESKSGIDTIGIDPLSMITSDYIKKWCKFNEIPIKDALCNHTIIADFDDIYSDELLFRCGINPEKKCSELSHEEYTRLIDQLPVAMQWGLQIYDMDDDGETKIRGKTLSAGNRNVYGRESQPCRKCGTKIQKIMVSGEECCYCPVCQSINGGIKRIKASDVTPEILAPVAQFIGSHIQTIGYFGLYMIPDETGRGIREYSVTWEEFVAYAYDYINSEEIRNKDYGDGATDQTLMKQLVKSRINDDSFVIGISWIQKQNWR